MSAQAKPFRVGLFVIGAVVLVLGGLVAFGSGDFFRTRYQFVAFFPGSVAGLRPGAAVAFRGVPVGQVTRIVAQYDPTDMSARVAVYFETIEGSIDDSGRVGSEAVAEEFRKLIDRGLRAQLVPQSFVTGQLYIQLEVRPDTDVRLVGDVEPGVTELPTIPSTFDVLDTQLKTILGSGGEAGGLESLLANLDELTGDANVSAITRILSNIEAVTEAVAGREDDLVVMIQEARTAVGRADDAMGKMSALADDARTAVGGFGAVAALLQDPDEGLQPVVENARGAARSIGRMADQINNLVAESRPGIRDFSEGTLPAIDGLVLDLEQLAQKLSRVADQLERDPSGFFLGRGQREGIR